MKSLRYHGEWIGWSPPARIGLHVGNGATYPYSATATFHALVNRARDTTILGWAGALADHGSSSPVLEVQVAAFLLYLLAFF